MKKSYLFYIFFIVLALVLSGFPKREVQARPQHQITSPSQLIDAVNGLRISYGLAPLPSHPILMQSAQAQADYMASTGQVTHSRPGGITYTQQLISLGFPLAGDLSLGGFRAENIVSTYGPLTWDGVPPAWQDAEHMNTMLSGNFTHIGAGISQSGDSYYYAVDTAAATGSGQQQSSASTILTSVPGGASESAGVSQFMVPVTLSTARPDGNVFHKVQYGQSLWSIAIAYGVTIDELKRLNGLLLDDIYEGQKLLIRRAATETPTASPAPVTATLGIPTSTATVPAPATITPTFTPVPTAPASLQSGGVVVGGIVLIALLAAGLGAFLSRNRNKLQD